jgi:hypothetical protein
MSLRRLFSKMDCRYVTVELYDFQYKYHIQDRHPNIEVKHLLQVITKPDLIVRDMNYDTRENYYLRGIIPNQPTHFLKVCVDFTNPTGKIITAFVTDKPKKGERVIWPR